MARRTAAPVDDDEFVVAGCQAAPLLDVIEVSFNDVSSFVILGVEGRGPASSSTAALAVGDLVGGFGNDRDNPALPQPCSRCSAGVGLIAADAGRTRAWPATAATVDFQVRKQMLQHGAVVGLAGAHEHYQRSSSSVDEVMNLAGQPAAGAANAVVRRLARQIRVIRPSPLCHG
jgi:hypothetical protein